MFKVYKLTDLVTGKVYVGQTSRTLLKRVESHRHVRKGPLYKLFCGRDLHQVKVEVLAEFDTRKKARTYEGKMILALRSYEPEIGFNQTFGSSHTEKTKRFIGEKSKTRNRTPEQIEQVRKLGFARKGKKASPETIEKLRESHLGQVAWNKGKKLSAEHRENLRLAKLGTKQSDEHKASIAKALKAFHSKGKE